nr:DUF6087 family protein [Streptomyces carminius]
MKPVVPSPGDRWNGSSWELFAVADDLEQARRIVRPPAEPVPGEETPGPAPDPLAPGRGRHRRPR